MDKNLVFCKICNKETIYSRQTFAKYHLSTHNIVSKQYYDLFKLDSEGLCKICGKETCFRNIVSGYAIYCSNKCSILDKDLSQQKTKTRLEKEKIIHNGKIFLQTDNYKNKRKLTKKEKYGDENYCNKDKIKLTKKEKYGDENYCNKDKILKTLIEKYGDKNYNLKKGQLAIIEKYGVDNYFKTPYFRKMMEEMGRWTSWDKLDDFETYNRMVKKETRKWKKELFEKWNGLDFYSNQRLIDNKEWKIKNPELHESRNMMQPTIDHKISIVCGFKNNIDAKEIGHISNLCICSRLNNCKKSINSVK